MNNYQLAIIGGGPAGYLAAERAAQGGLSAIVFEQRALGGVCLNEGCIPSKALLNSAKIYEYATGGEKYGVFTSDARFDHPVAVARKDKVVKQLVTGIGLSLKKHDVTVVQATASVRRKTAQGFEIDCDGTIYIAENLLIATGSAPIVPPIPGLAEALENGFVMTNREILDIPQIPERLVVIGGGVIGLEMASYFNAVGSKVTVIEMMDNIAGNTDDEIADLLMKALKKKGIKFILSAKVTAVGDGTVAYEEKEEVKTVECDTVLLSVGRKPVIESIGLENLGVAVERGAIVTDDTMRTNVAGVYAAGDVNGKSMLAHTAYRESEVAINRILGTKDTMRYEAVPSVIYTNPEVACVGETLASAKAKGMDVRAVTVSMRMSGRYMAETDGGNGIAKFIFDNRRQCLVGVHLIGSYASEIIYGASLMLETQLPAESLKKLVFPHPTVSEIIREALFQF